MILATQYYRPPFPERRRWREDMQAIRRAGLNTVYLWVCWGWVEPAPGRFEFGDYDELFEHAAAAGLQVVLNTIGEIQPFWIHREISDGHLIDHQGRAVTSTLRIECNVGLTPGGCTDHPQVRERMGGFLTETARRYAGNSQLVAWDLWNETRWAAQAGGHVCHCPSTLAAFRGWLERRYGSLDGLNEAWRRRYCSWEDVQPGKVPGNPFTDMLEFEAFLTWRAREHMAFRHARVRAEDAEHLIVAHHMSPGPVGLHGEPHEPALSRGNDWEYTDFLDGFGASLFPAWFHGAGPDLGARAECARSAAQDKLWWVGELQGGSARSSIHVKPSVTAAMQQRWLWGVIGRGAKAVNFWCWRDEVFSREASGFGISGNDGYAAERVASLARTGDAIARHGDLLDRYRPDPATVGVVFEPRVYQLDWAQFGAAHRQAAFSLLGYLHALERLQVPYEVLESRHREALANCRLLVMPWPLIVDPDLAGEVLEWVRAGGTLLVESELDAYDVLGFYRYPDERPFANSLGLLSRGRRAISAQSFSYEVEGAAGELSVAEWVEPIEATDGDVLGAGEHGALLVSRQVGSGRVVGCGTFAGLAYEEQRAPGFERFVGGLVALAGARPELRCSLEDGDVVQWRLGGAGHDRLLFAVNEGDAEEIRFSGPGSLFGEAEAVEDLVTGERLDVVAQGSQAGVQVPIGPGGYRALRWRP